MLKKEGIQKNASKLTALQQKMHKKLMGGKFRWINEKLYTSSSAESLKMFQKDPSLFSAYHEGFSSQVKSWPKNPVDIIIQQLKDIKKKKVVADMGCGDAKIARNCSELHKIHSFDLHAANEYVHVADISKVPLPPKSVDIVIFCLSLMGLNYNDFLKEALRILKFGGLLKIAEVTSRLESLDMFCETISSLGFRLLSKDDSNNYFTILEFQKIESKKEFWDLKPALKPCVYKKR